ncbi:MAG: hypothetical protein JXB49_03580 [Bacteroidales bacterium]|nr:hypothetical protein [Bacteroidales bacterium]
MAGISKIEHKGKEIFFIDYDGCANEEEMVAILKKAQQEILKEQPGYLQLTNLKNAFATSNFMNEAKKVARETPRTAKKRAIVGVDNPARKILLQAYNLIIGSNGMKPFNTLEEAKDWLVE